MPACALPEKTVLKTNQAHSPKTKVFLENNKKEIEKLHVPSDSLSCKNITTSGKDLLKGSAQNVLFEVPLEKSEGDRKVILVGRKTSLER